MKRFLLIFICMALLCGFFVPALAENEEVQTRTLTVKAPDSWEEVYVYSWEEVYADNCVIEDLGEYPGTKLEKYGDVYEITVKSSLVNLVISGLTASGERVDESWILLQANGKNVTVTIDADTVYTLAYEGEEPEGKPSEYRVTGDVDWMGNWDPANARGIMYEVEPGALYRKVFYHVEPGQYELVITKGGEWEGFYGDRTDGNIRFTVEEKCKVVVDLSLKDGNGHVSVYGTNVYVEENIGAFSGTVTPGEDTIGEYRITGSTDWLGNWMADNDAGIMDELEPGVLYQKVFRNVQPGQYAFKITKDGTWDVSYGADDGNGYAFTVNTEADITVELRFEDGVAQVNVTGSGSPFCGSPEGPEDTVPNITKPIAPDATEPTDPASPDSDYQPSPLVNAPITFGPILLFGIFAVCIYFIFLLRRRSRDAGDVTPEGKVYRRTRLSAKAVTRMVQETMPEPSPALDDAVMEAVRSIKQPPNEP